MLWFSRMAQLATNNNLSPIDRGEGHNLEMPKAPQPVKPLPIKKKKKKVVDITKLPLRQDRSVPGYAQDV